MEAIFKQDLKNRIDETSKYIRPEEGTFDFALMFIPAEGIYYDLMVINTPDLIVPHPKIAVRRFVLMPLTEIAPDLKDPVTGITVMEMLANCPDGSLVKLIAKKDKG